MPATQSDRLQGISTSTAVKPPCKAVSTSTLTLSGEQTVNGVSCVDGDRVLYALTGGSVNNGIWVVRANAWERAKDFDGARDVVKGTLVLVAPGAADSTIYAVTTSGEILPGTTSLAIEPFSGDAASLLNDLASTGAINLGDAMLGVKQPTASAVARNQHNKNAERKSLLDYRGDVVSANDTAAAQAMLDEVGYLYIPDGCTCTINGGRLTHGTSDVEIYGDGWNSKVVWVPATDTPADDWGMLNIRGTNVAVISRVRIHDLYFDFGSNKNASYDGFKRGIHIYNANDIEITGCYFKGARGEMVGLNNRGSGGCLRAVITNNIFEDFVQNALNPNAQHMSITGNIFRNGGPSSKVEIGGQYWSFTGNYLHNMTFGLDLSCPSDFTITGNSFYEVDTGIQFSNQTPGTASYRGAICGNTFYTSSSASGEYGIHVGEGAAGAADNSHISVTGNVVVGYNVGIKIQSDNHGVVSGNTVDGLTTAATGIEVGSSGGSVVSALIDGNVSVNNTNDYSLAALSSGEVVLGENIATNGQYTAADTIGSTANQATLTGSTSETDLKSVAVKAKTMPTGQGVRVRANGETLGTAGNKTIRLYFGVSLVGTIPAFSTASVFQIEATLWAVSATAQSWNVKAYVGTTLVLNAVVATAVNTGSNQNILITGQLANAADSILLYGTTVEKF